jgi:hypothetical protein
LRLLRRPRFEHFRFGYERGGVAAWDELIPWNAEAVLVEGLVWLPHTAGRAPEEYRLHSADALPVRASEVHPGPRGLGRVSFRLPPPQGPNSIVLCWKAAELGQARIPYLPEAEFLAGLHLEAPTILVQLGNRFAPCQAVVRAQGGGLFAAGLLTSLRSLLPLAGTGLTLEFAQANTSQVQVLVPVWTRAQLTSRKALVIVPMSQCPDRLGDWQVRWSVCGRPLGGTTLRVLSARELEDSLYLVDTSYRCEMHTGQTALRPFLTVLDDISRVGPYFRVASRQRGAAGLLSLEVRTRPRDPGEPAECRAQEVVVTDAPSPVMPPALPAEDFHRVEAFELFSAGRKVGTLAADARPPVAFTSEGGFNLAADFDWTPSAERELADRLERLIRTPEAAGLNSLARF